MKRSIFIALVCIVMFACKKSKEDAPAPASITGYWTGTWSQNGRSGQNELAVVLWNNNRVRILTGFAGGDTSSAARKTEDLYTYEDGVARFEWRDNTFRYAYRGEAKGNTMTGTWGVIPSEDDGGTWKITRH